IQSSDEQLEEPQLLVRYEANGTVAGIPVRTAITPLIPWGERTAVLKQAKVTVSEMNGDLPPRTMIREIGPIESLFLGYNQAHVVAVEQPTPGLFEGEAWLVDKVTVTDAYGDSRPLGTWTTDGGNKVQFEWTPGPDDHGRIIHKLAPPATWGEWYKRLDRDVFGSRLPWGFPFWPDP